jgi:hypothetical protein
MFTREAPTLTLPDIRERLEEVAGGETVSARSSEIAVDLISDHPSIRVKDREVPATAAGLLSLAARLDIPRPFFEKTLVAMPDLQQHLLTEMLAHSNAADVHEVMLHNERGLLEIRPQGRLQIDPRRIVDVAERVISPEAQVLNYYRELGREFRLDVLVPQDFDRGIGGDPAIDDLTHAGLRFTQDMRSTDQFHAPEVSLLMYRLICTNGMERMTEERSGPDARGKSVDEVMAEFEEYADRMFRRAEQEIETFYAMREERVLHPEQAILRVAAEAGLPDRLAATLTRRVPEMPRANDDSVSMFDIVNLVTNAANDPAMRRETGRRALERIGGVLIGDHAARCTHCQSRLN